MTNDGLEGNQTLFDADVFLSPEGRKATQIARLLTSQCPEYQASKYDIPPLVRVEVLGEAAIYEPTLDSAEESEFSTKWTDEYLDEADNYLGWYIARSKRKSCSGFLVGVPKHPTRHNELAHLVSDVGDIMSSSIVFLSDVKQLSIYHPNTAFSLFVLQMNQAGVVINDGLYLEDANLELLQESIDRDWPRPRIIYSES